MLALSENGELNWMYIGDEKEMFSFRQYDKYILLGGRAHRIGENQAGGQYASEHPNWFVATRFQKWGMDYKETE